jgi:hypothetical protein
MTEAKLQAEIVQLLQKAGIYFFSVPNEGSQNKVRTMSLMGMGLRPGASDLVLVLKNRIVFMEVKTRDGKQSPAQERFESRVKELGHEYVVVRNLNDVELFVKST